MTEVSVVMATYQGACFVGEQVASLLHQRQQPAELIVSDDQSTDGTLEIIGQTLREAPFPVRLHVNSERKGFRRNFVEAASLASAPLVAFCDQDDVWRPDKIDRMARVFDDSEVLLAYHNAALTDRDGRPTGRLYGSGGGRKTSESSRIEPWSSSLGFTQVFRRDLLAFNHLQGSSRDFLFPSEVLAHDQWYYFLASAFGKVAFVDEDLVAYRQHESNVFGAVDRGKAKRLDVIRATLDHSPHQIEARGASLRAKVSILRTISDDQDQPIAYRHAAGELATHLGELGALYATRVQTYGRSVTGKAVAWTRLVSERRRLRALGLIYPARHAARDLTFGVLLGHLAAPLKRRT